MVPKLLRRLTARPAARAADESSTGRVPVHETRDRPEPAGGPLPSAWVKMHVWRRDDGKCVRCGGREGVWFDYIVPVRQGGSATEQNIRLMCWRCRRAHAAPRRRNRSGA